MVRSTLSLEPTALDKIRRDQKSLRQLSMTASSLPLVTFYIHKTRDPSEVHSVCQREPFEHFPTSFHTLSLCVDYFIHIIFNCNGHFMLAVSTDLFFFFCICMLQSSQILSNRKDIYCLVYKISAQSNTPYQATRGKSS